MKLVKLLLAIVLGSAAIVKSSKIKRRRKNKEAKSYEAKCAPSKLMDTWFGQCKSGLKCDEEEKICLVGTYQNCADMTDKNHRLLSSRTLRCIADHVCLYKSGDWTQGDPEWTCVKAPK